MHRDLVIDSLVLDYIDKIIESRHTLWLQLILTNGFSGFANMDDEELRRACAERGLRCEEGFHEPQQELDNAPDTDDDDDEFEVRSLLSATRYSGVSECL